MSIKDSLTHEELGLFLNEVEGTASEKSPPQGEIPAPPPFPNPYSSSVEKPKKGHWTIWLTLTLLGGFLMGTTFGFLLAQGAWSFPSQQKLMKDLIRLHQEDFEKLEKEVEAIKMILSPLFSQNYPEEEIIEMVDIPIFESPLEPPPSEISKS